MKRESPNNAGRDGAESMSRSTNYVGRILQQRDNTQVVRMTVVWHAFFGRINDLWIWHAFFGAPGTMNDLNILDRSPVFDDIINGIAPQVNFNVNGREYHLAYYLTDDIYPKWATFIQSIRLP